jgi:hypothetical protein
MQFTRRPHLPAPHQARRLELIELAPIRGDQKVVVSHRTHFLRETRPRPTCIKARARSPAQPGTGHLSDQVGASFARINTLRSHKITRLTHADKFERRSA